MIFIIDSLMKIVFHNLKLYHGDPKMLCISVLVNTVID